MPDAMVSGYRNAVAALVFLSVIVYRFFELHIIGDLLHGFWGDLPPCRVQVPFPPRQVPGNAVVGEPSSVDIVSRNIWEASFIHL
jgi:hypothetical protein